MSPIKCYFCFIRFCTNNQNNTSSINQYIKIKFHHIILKKKQQIKINVIEKIVWKKLNEAEQGLKII